MFDNLRPDSTRGIRQRAKKHAEQPRTIDNMSREKHEKNYQNLILIAEAIILVCILCVTVFASAFYSLDAAICDKLYTNFRGVSNDIRIIAIDEETLEAYGNFANWSRQKTADLLQLLCADQENEPAVIGVDILFTGESDARADARLAEAAEKACPIVLASNLVYRGSTKQNREGELYYDTMHVDMVEEPYAALRKAGRMGYTNAFVAADGRIRYTKLFEDHNTNAESFAWSLYEIYENAHGRQAGTASDKRRGTAALLLFRTGRRIQPRFLKKRIGRDCSGKRIQRLHRAARPLRARLPRRLRFRGGTRKSDVRR